MNRLSNEGRPSYLDRPEWHRYQRFLPPEMRYHAAGVPQEEWYAWEDAEIHVDRLARPEAPVRVILFHGGGGNGRVLMPFATMIHNAGYEVIAPDMPGYGLTQYGKRSRPNYELWSRVGSDLVDAELASDDRPVVVYGLSIGGMLAYLVAARNPRVSGLIATTLLDLRERDAQDMVARNRIMSRVGGLAIRLVPALTDNIRLPMKLVSKMDLITNDPDFSRVFASDPLAGGSTMRVGFMRSLFVTAPTLEPEEFTTCPVLLAHPAVDPWTPVWMSKRFFDRIAAEKELVVLEGAGHVPYEEPGRTALDESVSAFLARVAAAATAPATTST